MKKNFYEATLEAIQKAKEKYGSARAVGEATGVDPVNISRWENGKRKPRVEEIAPILDTLGAEIVFPDQNADRSREVCFVNTRIVNTEDSAPPIIPEDYLAVPLVTEAGAGPGIIPNVELESWFLVYRSEPSIRFRTNLIAVRVAKGSTSMVPTLFPGDIILVDRNDRAVSGPGRIWLVMEPGDEGGGKIKRVKIDDLRDKRQTRITYYSDNVTEHPPEVYTLEDDFEGDISRAIIGRVVWAWTDVSKK